MIIARIAMEKALGPANVSCPHCVVQNSPRGGKISRAALGAEILAFYQIPLLKPSERWLPPSLPSFPLT